MELSYRTLRDGALAVSGSAVERAWRVEQGSNQRWNVRIAPGGDEAVTVTLPATADCAASGAVCTGGGKALSAGVSATVPGPVPVPVPQTPQGLTAAFEPGRRLDAEAGYGFSVMDDRAVATPYAGMTRTETSAAYRLGQRLKVGASEWSVEGAFADDGRTFTAGYGYRLGSALELNLEASRREPANDDAPEHAVVLRAGLRW